MKIRTLTAADWPHAQALYRDLSDGPEIGTVDAFQTVLAHNGTRIFGADNAGQVVAMVTLHMLPNVTYGGRPYALLENVVTAKAFRGRGIGKTLMQSVIDVAWDEGAYKIMLLTGRTRNAKGFYEALGFKADEKWGMSLRKH